MVVHNRLSSKTKRCRSQGTERGDERKAPAPFANQIKKPVSNTTQYNLGWRFYLPAIQRQISLLSYLFRSVHQRSCWLADFGIQVSMSTKASPWENGFQESFYNNFKTDLGLEFDRFETEGHFLEEIHECKYLMEQTFLPQGI